MSQNKNKNAVLSIAVIFLFLALINGLPYGFFTFLRFIVFTASAYVAWAAYKVKKQELIWVFGFLAVLFNPFILVHLNREIWSVIDFITGLFMLVSIFVLKL